MPIKIELSSEDLEFKEEVRRFLDEKLTPELRAASARQAGVFADKDVSQVWHRILYERGWIAPAWPKEYGGTGWSPVQRYLFESACADVGTPILPAMGLGLCGPVLIGYGTARQKDYFLPRMLSGEHYWCQGYSEPQAGSDLASLQCRAVRDGDHYVVNGTKIWTTHGHLANWLFLLVRTDAMVKPQAGLSFMLTPMDVPGLTVRPILSLAGEHELNQLFFDDMRIPVENRVGDENDGWSVAKYLLEFERGGGSHASKVRRILKKTKEIAGCERADSGGALLHDPDFSRRLVNMEVALAALDMTERRVIAGLSTGKSVGNMTASMLKLRGAETIQKASELAMEALGLYGIPDQMAALGTHPAQLPVGPAYAAGPTAKYLGMRAITVYGGTAEVQRNILARAILAA